MKFAVYLDPKTKEWSAVLVRKDNLYPKIKSFVGLFYSVSKSLAISKAKKSNLDSPLVEKSSSESIFSKDSHNKVIYCDYNGVLDHFEKTMAFSSDSSLNNIKKTINMDSLYKLALLTVKTNSRVVFTSLFRNFGISFSEIFRFLRLHNDPDVVKFYHENSDYLLDNCWDITPNFGSRTEEIFEHVKRNNVSNCVVFEDEHFIDPSLNPIMTNTVEGLLYSHFEKAYSVLG